MIRALTSINGLLTRSGGTDLGTLALMLASLLCAVAVIKLSAFGNLSLPRAHVMLPLCLISMSGTNCSIPNAIVRTSFPKLEFDRAFNRAAMWICIYSPSTSRNITSRLQTARER